jgi:hypothetical protein
VKLGGGAVSIDGVVTTARVTTAGGKPKLEGKTTVVGLTVGGTPASVDDNGVHGAAAALEALDASGISLRVANPADVVKGSAGSRSAAGLLVTLTPAALRAAVGALPPDLAAQVASTVVLDQTVTVSLGGIFVAAAASPALTHLLTGEPEPSFAGHVGLPGAADLGGSAPESAAPVGGRLPSGYGDSSSPSSPSSGEAASRARVLRTRPAAARLRGGYSGLAPVWVFLGLLAAGLVGLRIRRLVDTVLFAPLEEE